MTPTDQWGLPIPVCISKHHYCHEWRVVYKSGSTWDQRSRLRICTACKLVAIRRGPASVYKMYVTKEYEEARILRQLVRELE